MNKQLPKKWIEGHLYDLTEPVKTGVKLYEGEKEYYSTGSIKEKGLSIEGVYSFEKKPSRANREVKVNDVLQARMSDTDKAIIINDVIKESLFSTGFMQLRVYDGTIIPKYIFYYLKSYNFNIQKNELASGTTQVAINDLNAKKITFPLAPLSEQNRIVEKLDNLFNHLEIIKKSMANIPLLLKDFRQQILTQAVTGKLTEEWRKGKEMKLWKNVLLNDICNSITDGDHQAPPQVSEGIPFLVISNVSKGYFEFEKVSRFVTQEYYNSLKDIRKPQKGDLLYTVTGSYGIPLLVDFDKEFCFQRHIAILRPNTIVISSNFLKILLTSNLILAQAHDVATGTAQLTVPLGGIKKFKVKLPTLQEQQEIVSRVESLFAKAEAIEQQYKSLKDKIDTLPQALLHKAFKGELSDQLVSDGDAKELLKEINRLKNISRVPIKKKIKEKTSEKQPIIDKKKLLVDSIKKILKEKTNGISYKELITNFYDNSQEDLITDIIQELIINNIIYQEFSTEQKRMLIKINQ